MCPCFLGEPPRLQVEPRWPPGGNLFAARMGLCDDMVSLKLELYSRAYNFSLNLYGSTVSLTIPGQSSLAPKKINISPVVLSVLNF